MKTTTFNDLYDFKTLFDSQTDNVINLSKVTFKQDLVDSWLVLDNRCLNSSNSSNSSKDIIEFKNKINQLLVKLNMYNPFTLKAVVNGKGNVKLLIYNINRYKKENIIDMFQQINNLK